MFSNGTIKGEFETAMKWSDIIEDLEQKGLGMYLNEDMKTLVSGAKEQFYNLGIDTEKSFQLDIDTFRAFAEHDDSVIVPTEQELYQDAMNIYERNLHEAIRASEIYPESQDALIREEKVRRDIQELDNWYKTKIEMGAFEPLPELTQEQIEQKNAEFMASDIEYVKEHVESLTKQIAEMEQDIEWFPDPLNHSRENDIEMWQKDLNAIMIWANKNFNEQTLEKIGIDKESVLEFEEKGRTIGED